MCPALSLKCGQDHPRRFRGTRVGECPGPSGLGKLCRSDHAESGWPLIQ
jgi:hypothetical protein